MHTKCTFTFPHTPPVLDGDGALPPFANGSKKFMMDGETVTLTTLVDFPAFNGPFEDPLTHSTNELRTITFHNNLASWSAVRRNQNNTTVQYLNHLYWSVDYVAQVMNNSVTSLLKDVSNSNALPGKGSVHPELNPPLANDTPCSCAAIP